jgi:hypothetical protein
VTLAQFARIDKSIWSCRDPPLGKGSLGGRMIDDRPALAYSLRNREPIFNVWYTRSSTRAQQHVFPRHTSSMASMPLVYCVAFLVPRSAPGGEMRMQRRLFFPLFNRGRHGEGLARIPDCQPLMAEIREHREMDPSQKKMSYDHD